MIGSILGGIFGAASAGKQAKMLSDEKDKNQRWYDRRYNEDSTQRADAQSALTAMREAMKERTAASAGAAAVTGGTGEQVAAEKAVQNSALADTIGNIARMGDARKDNIEAQYQARDAQLSQQQLDAEKAKAMGIAQAGAGLDATIGSAIGAGGNIMAANILNKKQ